MAASGNLERTTSRIVDSCVYAETIVVSETGAKLSPKAAPDKIAKARKAVEWAQYDFKKALSETPEIQEIIRRIKSFQKKSKSFKTACNDKSRLAKINVTISDENVREALKEIIDFKI